jgi:hypothetical protein
VTTKTKRQAAPTKRNRSPKQAAPSAVTPSIVVAPQLQRRKTLIDAPPATKKRRVSPEAEVAREIAVIEISDSESEPEAEAQPEPEANSDVDIVLPKVKIESDTLFSKLPLPVQNALRKYGTPNEVCLRASLRDKMRIGAFLLELQTEMQRKVQEDRSFQDCIFHDVDRIAATVTIRETFWGT